MTWGGAPPPPAPVWRVSRWHVRERVIEIDRPLIVGIINVTPDSFSDGGHFFSADAAVAHAEQLLAEGADGLDVGGESTRPQGAVPVDAAEERRRVLPVIRELSRRFPRAVLSVDTVKADVAEAALAEGAHVVNDVSAMRLDPRMARVVAHARAGVVLMHSRGGVADMGTYAHATYSADAAPEVFAELRSAVTSALASGISADAVVVDPGIGFAKRSAHSVAMLAALPVLAEWGFPVLVGVSRKRFLGELTGESDPLARLSGATGANVVALTRGARVFRVHDVRPARQSLDVAWAILRAAADAGVPRAPVAHAEGGA